MQARVLAAQIVGLERLDGLDGGSADKVGLLRDAGHFCMGNIILEVSEDEEKEDCG